MCKKPPKISYPCPVCEDVHMATCPECHSTREARCHRCRNKIYVGDWIARELTQVETTQIEIFFCKACSEEVGIEVGPRLKLVA